MSSIELILLENILDSLDRLFDRDSKTVDVFALIFATSIALNNTNHFQILDETAKKLENIFKITDSENELREAALFETDELRHYAAKLFPPFVSNK